MSKRLDKEIRLLMRKNRERCSICKQHYDEVGLNVFTCTGYDKRHKLQTTTLCCYEQLVTVVRIGVYGAVREDKADDILKEHPLYDSLFASQKAPHAKILG